MLWDAKSKGTLQNRLNLVGAGKRTLVLFFTNERFSRAGDRTGFANTTRPLQKERSWCSVARPAPEKAANPDEFPAANVEAVGALIRHCAALNSLPLTPATRKRLKRTLVPPLRSCAAARDIG
jgi:hypothetical protein